MKVDCGTQGCEHKASRYPRICMVAIGDRRSSNNALKMMMPLAVCPECQAKMGVENFLLPEGKRRIAAALFAVGKAPPDFDNAWLEWGRIGDAGWLMAIQAERNGATLQ